MKEFLDTVSEKTEDFLSTQTAVYSYFGILLVWMLSRPLWSETSMWLAVFSTFCDVTNMALLIIMLRSQKRDRAAMHAKTDEILEMLCPNPDTKGVEDQGAKDAEAKRKAHV